MESEEELDIVHTCLETAKEYDLESEVILSALKWMRDDSTVTPVQAMFYALGDWVK